MERSELNVGQWARGRGRKGEGGMQWAGGRELKISTHNEDRRGPVPSGWVDRSRKPSTCTEETQTSACPEGVS